jgi:hypothetical protein
MKNKPGIKPVRAALRVNPGKNPPWALIKIPSKSLTTPVTAPATGPKNIPAKIIGTSPKLILIVLLRSIKEKNLVKIILTVAINAINTSLRELNFKLTIPLFLVVSEHHTNKKGQSYLMWYRMRYYNAAD